MKHSQYDEEMHIAEFFKGFTGRFLDLGAFDGVVGSNTRALSDRGWSGVCVEANPFTFAKLLANHNDNPKVACVNAAVMPRDGLVRFYESTIAQLSTCLSKENLGQYVKSEYWVSAVTPRMIFDTFSDPFDFVSLDVEGVDLEVLREMGPLLEGTKLLCFEDAIPMREFSQEYYEKMLTVAGQHGFTKVIARTVGNTLVARE